MFVLILPVSIYVYDQHKTQVFYLSIVTVDWFYGKLRAKLPILIDSVVNSSHNTVFVVSIYTTKTNISVFGYTTATIGQKRTKGNWSGNTCMSLMNKLLYLCGILMRLWIMQYFALIFVISNRINNILTYSSSWKQLRFNYQVLFVKIYKY